MEISLTDSNGNPVAAAQEPANASALCGLAVIGNRHLNGSLLARGSAPIPWA